MPAKTARIAEINDKMAGNDFWNNQERARQQTDELRKLKTTVGPLQKLVSGAEDLQVLMEFAEEDESGESEAELKATVERLAAEIDRVELQVTMSNPADSLRGLSHRAGR